MLNKITESIVCIGPERIKINAGNYISAEFSETNDQHGKDTRISSSTGLYPAAMFNDG